MKERKPSGNSILRIVFVAVSFLLQIAWLLALTIKLNAYSTALSLVSTILSLLVVLRLMQRIVHVNTLKRLEVQFIHRTQTLAFLNDYFNTMGVKILDVDFHAENRPEGNLYTNLYTLSMPSHTSYVDIIGTLSEHQNIRTVRTRNL